jgi:hypothetical protein
MIRGAAKIYGKWLAVWLCDCAIGSEEMAKLEFQGIELIKKHNGMTSREIRK